MGWLSKIFGGSNRSILDKSYNCRYRTDIAGNQSSEFEDINQAIAKSLSGDQRGEYLVDGEVQLQEDELARSVLESWDTEYQPESSSRTDYGTAYGYGYASDSLYQPIAFSYSTSFGICAACNIDVGHGRYLSCMNALWHPECFRCHGCNHPISDYEFSVYESYPYHKACYKEVHHPRCDVCRHIIPTNADGLIEYRAHPFWSQKYCPKHEHDGTPRCCSCEQMESWNTRFTILNDGRKLCLDCLDSAIMDTKECQPLLYDMQKFFKSLNMKVVQQIPLLLVEKPALIEAMGGETNGRHHHTPETRGLCLAEEHTINQILRRPRIGFGNRIRTQPFKLTRSCKVTAILILYGLPRLLTGIILAHEMMHAWLRLNGYHNLSQDVEEGMCQVVASMWLESRIESMSDRDNATTSSKQGSTSLFDRKLGKFLKHQISTDSSAVYGNGFRAGHRSVIRFGLQRTLDHLRRTGHFPGEEQALLDSSNV